MNRIMRNRMDALALVAVVAILLAAMAACVPSEFRTLAVNMTTAGTTEDGVDYSPEDILIISEFGGDWYKIFDGSDYGLKPKHNIQAFTFNEVLWYNLFFSGTFSTTDTIPELYLSFAPNSIGVPGAGKVAGQDIVRFSDPEFELFFDGSDVGLTTNGEKIDGLGIVPPEYYDEWVLANVDADLPYDCTEGIFFVTTMGQYRVPAAVGGVIRGFGSDILLFCAFNTGADTAGVWYRVYNGKEEGITPYSAGFGLDVFGFELNDVTSAEQAPDLDAYVEFYFTARKPFTAPGLVEPGQTSRLYEARSGSGVYTTTIDFNDLDGPIPAINGTVDSVGVYDLPVEFAAP